MMRIPGFKESIFPTESMPVFNNVANLGLIIFLFLVALEVDIRLFTANWKIALSVGFAGMVLPFGLGCAIAWGLYHQFRNDPGIVPISFGIYALFIGTAMAITAFPVLCRILTELKLLRSNVGVTVLAAGIGNDVTGWILLALCVALVNNGSGLAALWCLLCGVGWTLFLVYAVRPCFMWALRRTGSLQNGPTQGMVALTMLLTLVSAWFTGIVGIHPIFGAFLVGLICPHDGGFAIKMTEKIEDLISVLFLPLYFALSGLSTNLGLLNDGITWGYVIGIIAIAFAGKIIGGTIAAKLCGMLWRESASVGALMSCKGLVEIIVLVSYPIPNPSCELWLINCRTLASKPRSYHRGPLPCLWSWPLSQLSPPLPSSRPSTLPGISKKWTDSAEARSTGTAHQPRHPLPRPRLTRQRNCKPPRSAVY